MKKIVLLIFNLVLILSIHAQNQIKTTSANLNFRTSPEIGQNVICLIPKGTILTIDYSNQSNVNWIRLYYKGKIGYVYSKYINELVLNNNIFNYDNNNSSSSTKYYTNSRGEKVQSPTYYNSPPAEATAECRDGTYSFSRSRKGTCSHHGGVKRWLK